MSGAQLSPQQVVNRLLLLARRMIRDHTPRAGRCPICRTPTCAPRQRAAEFIASHGPPPAPILRDSSSRRAMCIQCSIAAAYRLPQHPPCRPTTATGGELPSPCRCPTCHPISPPEADEFTRPGGGPPVDERIESAMWTQPRRTDDQPPLLEIGRDATGTRYVRRTGQRSNAVVTFSEEEWIELEQAIRHGQYF